VDVLIIIMHNNGTQEVHLTLTGADLMKVDLTRLRFLLSRRSAEIEKSVAGTGYLAKTVIGVGTFLLDNEGDVDLLTAKQKATFEKFILPLLGDRTGSPMK
jgi:hypothetical protein